MPLWQEHLLFFYIFASVNIGHRAIWLRPRRFILGLDKTGHLKL